MERTYSQISCFKRCPKKYKYNYLDMLSPKRTAKPLIFGDYTHNLLEAFYSKESLEEKSQKYFEEKTAKLFIEEIPMYSEMKNMVESIMANYSKKYQGDLERYNILSVEQQYRIPIIGTDDHLNGKMDLVMEDTQEMDNLYLMEHKTTAYSVQQRLGNIDLDEQCDYYLWAMKNYLANEGVAVSIAGVVYNVIRKKIPVIPHILKKGGLTHDKSTDTTADIYLQAILDNNLNPLDYTDMINMLKLKGDTFFGREIVRRTPNALENIGNDLTAAVKAMNNTTEFYRCASQDCVRDCQFRELCIAEKNGQNVKGILENFEVRTALNPELENMSNIDDDSEE